MEQLLALEMVRVTEAAAIASARVMGRGDRMEADRLATEAMRKAMDEIEMEGTIVIGEGERDEAPMLYIGEQVGMAGDLAPAIDIAVDPLEGTNLVATGSANAITVLAASERGGLVHAPDTYLEKLCVGPGAAGKVDITRPPAENVARIADSLGRKMQDITVIILDRPRHQDLIAEVRGTGARIKLISDGDLSAAISCAVQGTGVHAVMGTGGAPEGVITAAAMRCLGGEIQARFKYRNDDERARGERMGHGDESKIYRTDRGANLENANLSESSLRDASLLLANLKCSNLSAAKLTRTDLRTADLTGANLRGADLQEADLSGANLRGADLRAADLTDARLNKTNLTDANLCGARMPNRKISRRGCEVKKEQAISTNNYCNYCYALNDWWLNVLRFN